MKNVRGQGLFDVPSNVIGHEQSDILSHAGLLMRGGFFCMILKLSWLDEVQRMLKKTYGIPCAQHYSQRYEHTAMLSFDHQDLGYFKVLL